jgi:hypothetical protein
MTTADEYRQFAEDCLRRARAAKDESGKSLPRYGLDLDQGGGQADERQVAPEAVIKAPK